MRDPAWHEDEAFWREFAGMMFTPARWAAAALEIDGLLQLIRPSEGARVLDLPCGPGRHSIALARRGMKVTGVDLTKAYLDEARRRAGEEGVEIEWVCGDMREFTRPGEFDLVVNLYTSFGYFDEETNRAVARRFLELLRPGGTLVVDVRGAETLARDFQRRAWHEEADGRLFLSEHFLIDDWRRIRNRWIIVRDGRRMERVVEHRLYTAAELTDLLRGVGFESLRCHGAFDGRPYDEKAERLIVTARRARA